MDIDLKPHGIRCLLLLSSELSFKASAYQIFTGQSVTKESNIDLFIRSTLKWRTVRTRGSSHYRFSGLHDEHDLKRKKNLLFPMFFIQNCLGLLAHWRWQHKNQSDNCLIKACNINFSHSSQWFIHFSVNCLHALRFHLSTYTKTVYFGQLVKACLKEDNMNVLEE